MSPRLSPTMRPLPEKALTERMQCVLDAMRRGAELTQTRSGDFRYFLRDATGHTQTFGPTVWGLLDRGLVRQVDPDAYPVVWYELTSKGAAP